MFAIALFLLGQIGAQAPWTARGGIVSQPAFWPTVSLSAMTFFAALHLISSALSPRIRGRWREVRQWLASVEYALWFMLYVFSTPWIGYLPATILFAALLGWRAGYRSARMFAALTAAAVAIVVVFKSLLHVRIPAGAVYEHLPDGIRAFVLTNF